MATDAVAARPRGLVAAIAPLTAGHLATDFAQGALPALLPYLVTEYDLSYLQAGAIVLCATFANSIVQPLFGHWSDRHGATWLLPAGPAVAGIGIALLAIAPSYPAALVCVIVAGLGVAAYHPEATKRAAWIAQGQAVGRDVAVLDRREHRYRAAARSSPGSSPRTTGSTAPRCW